MPPSSAAILFLFPLSAGITKVSAPAPRPGILDIEAYVGGESSLGHQVKVIKLSSNEGPLGPSPRAIDAYETAAKTLNRYPDGGHGALRQAIAHHHGLDASRIVCGAGSDEIIGLLCRAYVGPGDEVLYSRHGFLMYSIAAKACGATPVIADEVDLTTSVDHLLAAVTPRTKIVFVANPNNPTGTYLPHDQIKRLRQGLPTHVLLVLDEAYAEFVAKNDYASGLAMVGDADDNVVVTRTFSKIFGLGGIRLGWGYCPAPVADVLNRIRNPFNVSLPALAAGKAAIEDTAFLDLCRAHNDHWLAWLSEKITGMGFEITPSVCNFVLVHFPTQAGRNAAAADAYLRSRGIIVRAMGGYGLGEWLRMTVGTAEENIQLIQALSDFVGQWE